MYTESWYNRVLRFETEADRTQVCGNCAHWVQILEMGDDLDRARPINHGAGERGTCTYYWDLPMWVSDARDGGCLSNPYNMTMQRSGQTAVDCRAFQRCGYTHKAR